jgi:hypothetical protein
MLFDGVVARDRTVANNLVLVPPIVGNYLMRTRIRVVQIFPHKLI